MLLSYKGEGGDIQRFKKAFPPEHKGVQGSTNRTDAAV